MSTEIKKPVKKDKMANPVTYVHIAIGVVLMFLGFILPPVGSLTEVGMQILFIFIGVIYLWTTVETLWSSLLALILYGMSDYTTVGQAFKDGLGDSTVQLVLFSMVFFGAILDTGVAQYISRWFLTRRISNGRPYIFCFIFIFGAYTVSTLTNAFTALLLSWPIAYTIVKDLGYTPKDRFSKFFVFGTFIGVILGQPAIPFRGAKLMMIKAFGAASGIEIDFLRYIVFDVIMATLIIFGLVLMSRFIYRVDVSKMKMLDVEAFNKNPLPAMNKTQKFYFYAMFLYILTLLIPSVLPTDWPIISTMSQLGAHGLTVLWIILCCVLRFDGKQALNFKATAGKHINWGVLFLVVIAIVMSSALTADETGIKPAIMGVLTPLLSGRSVWITAVILMVFSFLITNFANNAVCGSIIMPIFGAYALEAGITQYAPAIATCTMLCLYLAFLTPAASPYAGMLYGNREWLSPKDILAHGIPFGVFMMILYSTIGYHLSQFIFGL